MAVNSSTALGLAASASQDMYMKLLIAQLKNQDPMDPMSNAEMVSQMADLTAVEGMNKLNATFGEVLRLQQLTSGTQLVGRDIEFVAGDQVLQGTVDSVSTTGDAIRLSVGVHSINLDSILKIL